MLKTGGVDDSHKQCYHCLRKGHIKANCPERRKLGAQPWKKRLGGESRTYTWKRKIFGQEKSSVGGGGGGKMMCRGMPPKRWQEGKQIKKSKNIQQIKEDFQ